jgi:hypothetical protein
MAHIVRDVVRWKSNGTETGGNARRRSNFALMTSGPAHNKIKTIKNPRAPLSLERGIKGLEGLAKLPLFWPFSGIEALGNGVIVNNNPETVGEDRMVPERFVNNQKRAET